jgi:catechol 2,3-dioxygenase-like lactoylglutathione lyase family enzyme
MGITYDRTAEDLGNVVALEHVNVTVPDQRLATIFYVTALGLTRDPFLMTGANNMWVNVGRSQFHLPTNKPQVLRGRVGVVLPDRRALLQRLSRASKHLEGACFEFHERDDFVEAVCPWGNHICCHEPSERFGRVTLGIPYVEFDVPAGSADGIVRFYRQIIATPAAAAEDGRGRYARVAVGAGQELLFRETDRPLPPYDGHHIQVYVADFSGPYRRLIERGLISEESDQHQYRFKDIVEPGSGKVLFTIEHEVRSMRHPLYLRPLINRDPAQSNVDYAPGRDAWIWSMDHGD